MPIPNGGETNAQYYAGAQQFIVPATAAILSTFWSLIQSKYLLHLNLYIL